MIHPSTPTSQIYLEHMFFNDDKTPTTYIMTYIMLDQNNCWCKII